MSSAPTRSTLFLYTTLFRSLEAERKTKRDVLMKELQVGQVRKGIVKNITDFGAFIDLGGVDGQVDEGAEIGDVLQDRKSTRLNSSHRCISYAVFCLKKKTKN